MTSTCTSSAMPLLLHASPHHRAILPKEISPKIDNGGCLAGGLFFFLFLFLTFLFHIFHFCRVILSGQDPGPGPAAGPLSATHPRLTRTTGRAHHRLHSSTGEDTAAGQLSWPAAVHKTCTQNVLQGIEIVRARRLLLLPLPCRQRCKVVDKFHRFPESVLKVSRASCSLYIYGVVY